MENQKETVIFKFFRIEGDTVEHHVEFEGSLNDMLNCLSAAVCQWGVMACDNKLDAKTSIELMGEAIEDGIKIGVKRIKEQLVEDEDMREQILDVVKMALEAAASRNQKLED